MFAFGEGGVSESKISGTGRLGRKTLSSKISNNYESICTMHFPTPLCTKLQINRNVLILLGWYWKLNQNTRFYKLPGTRPFRFFAKISDWL